MDATELREPYYEAIIEEIRKAQQSVVFAKDHVRTFQVQKNSKSTTPMVNQWKEFTSEVVKLHSQVKELDDLIAGLRPGDGMFLRDPVQ